MVSLDDAQLTQSGVDLASVPLTITPVEPQEPQVPAKRPVGRPRASLKATAPSKLAVKSRRRTFDKESEEYKQRRERNNIAVRKSRDKAREKQQQTNERLAELQKHNDELQKKCDLLTKELHVLKGLFTNVGAALPKEFKAFMQKNQ